MIQEAVKMWLHLTGTLGRAIRIWLLRLICSKINTFVFRTFRIVLSALWTLPVWTPHGITTNVCASWDFFWGEVFDRASCEATLPSSAPPLSVEGGSVTAFLSTLVGNSYPSLGKCCLKGWGVLHLSPKTLNLCMEEFCNVGPSLPMHESM